jgi:hypothetical protein
MRTTKTTIKHSAFQNHDPITGEYNESVNPEGQIEITLGAYSVCPNCHGHGTHFINDWTEEKCDECYGQRVVREQIFPKWAEELFDSYYKSAVESAKIHASERAMGA